MSDTNDQMNAELQRYAQSLEPKQGACPNCGHCPHCGRAAAPFYPRPMYPYGPIWYYQPNYPNYTITYGVSNTGGFNA